MTDPLQIALEALRKIYNHYDVLGRHEIGRISLNALDEIAALESRPVQGIDTHEIENLVETLRSFSSAYPIKIFTPMSEVETKAVHQFMPGSVDRISAGMGRELSKWMSKAADMLENISSPQSPVQPATDAVMAALINAWDRMDRARDWLTEGKPNQNCNWGVLDTSLDRKALDQLKEADK